MAAAQPTIKPDSPAIQTYYRTLQEAAGQAAHHEGNVRRAFESLLAETAKVRSWSLVTEDSVNRDGRGLRYDGTLRDEWKLTHGWWEAKDSDDDLDAEIKKKKDRGYALDNIIFEDTREGVLYQNGIEVLRVDLRQAEAVARLLTEFYRYDAPPLKNFEQAIAEFKDRVPEIAVELKKRIDAAHRDNKKFQAAYEEFFTLSQTALNPNIRREAVDEMLIQHMLTERLIRKIFDVEDFVSRNVIADKIENVIAALTSKHFNRSEFLGALDRFYNAIEDAADEYAKNFTQKQEFLNTVYERFFQGYSVKVADTHGIVYTPQEIVDFMCAAVEEVLHTEFGLKLGDEGVNILDPCTGTGNFVVNLLNRVPLQNLERAYKQQLFANEVMLMPYYIAALNIEHAYYARSGTYEPFDGLSFVDTLDLAEGQQMPMFSEANSARVERQKAAPITVIIGNPPYNVGQLNENDNNKNRAYDVIDRRVRDTYAKDSKATLKTQLYDPYVKFFRWAADRLQGRDGIVCYVSNNSFVDQIAFDGMRKHLLQDFTQVYHLDLHGNVRQNPKLSGTTHNVFGIQVGVGITVAVRSSKHQEHKLLYHRVPEFWTKKEKLAWLAKAVKNPSPSLPLQGEGERVGLISISPSSQPSLSTHTQGEGETIHLSPSLPSRGEGERVGLWKTSPELWAKLKPLAREMRHEPTEAENHLWQRLRRKSINGYKFRRQHTFDRFIVDFYCSSAKLVVEVDGAIHEKQQEYDALRTAFLESLGLRVIRFTNGEVLQHVDAVLERIGEVLQEEPINPSLALPAQVKSEEPMHPSLAVSIPVEDEKAIHPSLALPAQVKGEEPMHPSLAVSIPVEDEKAIHPSLALPLQGEGTGGGFFSAPPADMDGKGSELFHVDWEPLTPDARNTWRIPENADEFATFLPMGSKATKAAKDTDTSAIFKLFSNGVKTNRDDVVYDFSAASLAERMNDFIERYNSEVDRYRRAANRPAIDDFVRATIKWDGTLKGHLRNLRYGDYDEARIRKSLYRPFIKRHLYFDRLFINSVYLQYQFLPTALSQQENLVICTPGLGNRKGFGCFLTNLIPSMDFAFEKVQCFPFYTYEPSPQAGRAREGSENITDWALAQFRTHYADDTISKWDIFYYVYALLHHPDYRARYADNLKRDLPRIPFAPDFRTFADAGRKLADLHLNYETIEPYKLEWVTKKDATTREMYRVEKMRLNKDKTAVVVNDSLTLKGIPAAAAFEYKLGNRSALDWVIDQYQVKTDKRSGITSDPNAYGDEDYIVKLVGRVVAVSVATVEIVNSLPHPFSLPLRVSNK